MIGNFSTTQKAWIMYDWANSVYSLVIATAIFPVYYVSITTSVDLLDTPFGGIRPAALYSFALTLSFLLVACASPLLASRADSNGHRHRFLLVFCSAGATACMLLATVEQASDVWLAVALMVVASVGFWGSLVFYNAYLPEIAPPELRDAISARGYAMGYLGSSLLLVTCLVLIMGHAWFGFESAATPTRLSFFLVGIWWLGFALLCLKYLPRKTGHALEKPLPASGEPPTATPAMILRTVWLQVRHSRNLRFYLLSYFFFSTGVQTIFYVANLYGAKELELDASKLIATILVIQIIAIAGALGFARLSARFGNLPAMRWALGTWACLCLLAFLMDKSQQYIEYYFYALGAGVGLVMGGIQALSRSTYAKLLPNDADNTTYFSFYDVLEKVGIVLGTLLVGITIQLTGSMKPTILMLGAMFVLSLFTLLPVRIKST